MTQLLALKLAEFRRVYDDDPQASDAAAYRAFDEQFRQGITTRPLDPDALPRS